MDDSRQMRQWTRRGVLTAIAVGVGVVVAIGALASPDQGALPELPPVSRPVEPPDAGPPELAGDWRVTAGPPLGTEIDAGAAWVGGSVVLTPTTNDGAVWDAASETWSVVPGQPVDGPTPQLVGVGGHPVLVRLTASSTADAGSTVTGSVSAERLDLRSGRRFLLARTERTPVPGRSRPFIAGTASQLLMLERTPGRHPTTPLEMRHLGPRGRWRSTEVHLFDAASDPERGLGIRADADRPGILGLYGAGPSAVLVSGTPGGAQLRRWDAAAGAFTPPFTMVINGQLLAAGFDADPHGRIVGIVTALDAGGRAEAIGVRIDGDELELLPAPPLTAGPQIGPVVATDVGLVVLPRNLALPDGHLLPAGDESTWIPLAPPPIDVRGEVMVAGWTGTELAVLATAPDAGAGARLLLWRPGQ